MVALLSEWNMTTRDSLRCGPDRNWTFVLRLSALAIPERSLRPVRDADALEDVRQVRFDGLLADRELARDALVRQSSRDEAQDVLLARRELGSRLLLDPRRENLA